MTPERTGRAGRTKRRRAGSGSIWRRADGRWCAAVWWPDGTRRYRYARSRWVARLALQELLAQRAAELAAAAPPEPANHNGALPDWPAGVLPT